MRSYETNYKKLFKDLDKSKTIVIDGRNYKELVNITYTIETDKNASKKRIQPHTSDDHFERIYLLGRLDHCIGCIESDVHSRRAVFSNLYDNQLGKCIVSVHAFVRDNKVHINEYYRSQEASRNFEYDKQTAYMLMERLCERLEKKPGTITVMVMSFHQGIK